MNLRDWIKKKFGSRGRVKAATFLGYPYKTVTAWVNLERFPRPATQEIIKLKTGGDIDTDAWRTAYLAAVLERKNT